MQSNHQPYFSMLTAHHQSVSFFLDSKTRLVRLKYPAADYSLQMKLLPAHDNEPNYSCIQLSLESIQNPESESSTTSPSVWSRAADAYLESRLRIWRSTIIETTPRTPPRNLKSSPISRAARRRVYAAARVCSKIIQSTERRLCQLSQSLHQWLYQGCVMTYSKRTNPPNDKMSHGEESKR